MNSLEHRGEWLRNIIKEKGFRIKEISILTGRHSSNISRDFSNKKMPFDRMKIICEHIGIDIKKYYPEASFKTDGNKWKEKFYKTSEKLQKTRELHDKIRRKYNELKKENFILKENYNELLKKKNNHQ